MKRVGPAERRTIMLGVGIVSLAWLLTRGAPMAARHADDARVRREMAVGALGAAKEAIAADPIARESLQARAGRLVALAPLLLDGATPAEAGASLAAIVGGRAAVRQVRILRQDARADSAASVFRRIALRIEAEGDVTGIASWVTDLEEGAKLLRIRSFSINAPEPTSAPTQPERIRAELIIEGWAAFRGGS